VLGYELQFRSRDGPDFERTADMQAGTHSFNPLSSVVKSAVDLAAWMVPTTVSKSHILMYD
jgi:hypothetical protein